MKSHTSHKGYRLFMAVLPVFAVFLLFTVTPAKAHQDPPGCSASGLSTVLGVTPPGVHHHGDTLDYTVTYANMGADACNITNLNASLTLANGSVITTLTNATLNVGDSITCPGSPACVTAGPYSYVVAHADETGPLQPGVCPPVPSGAPFPRRVTSYTQLEGTLHSVDGDDVATDCKTISNIVAHTPDIVTNVHNPAHQDITGQTVPVGTAVHDKVTVTDPNGFGTPTGTASFTVFEGLTCNGAILNSEPNVPLVNGAAESTPWTPGAGSFSYSTSYNGDTNFDARTANCEPFTVQRLDSTTATQVHNALHHDITNQTVPAGTLVHDQATVSGSGPMPTGFVDFTLQTGLVCDGQIVDVQLAVPLNNGVAESSSQSLNPGTYSYLAHYNGDGTYNASTGPCEPFTIDRYDSQTTTHVHNAAHQDITGQTIPVGTQVHDNAAVTSSGPAPTGTVDFQLYTSTTCQGDPTTEAGVPLAGGSAESTPWTTTVGPFGYIAVYSGDGNHKPSTGTCEPFTVSQLDSQTATQVHNANHDDITNQTVNPGTMVHDQATVSGSDGVPTGTVNFSLFSGLSCSGQALGTENDVALTNGVAESTPWSTTPGDYSYLAHYNGDTVYRQSDGPCEPFSVQKLGSTTTTQVHNAAHQDITNTTVPTGTVVHDNASVTGSGPVPTGTVDFQRFASADCTGTSVAENGVALVNGVAESSDYTATASLSYMAHYNGDAIYNPSTGVCEPLLVSGVTRTIGFWATHLAVTTDIFGSMSGAEKLICGPRTIDTLAELEGGFWSSISQKTNGAKRTQLDQARMQLIQQLLGAMLNVKAFGTNDGGLIAAGKTAFCTGSRSQILTAAGNLDTFNQSGDGMAFPPGFNPGSADPQGAKAAADMTLWDLLP